MIFRKTVILFIAVFAFGATVSLQAQQEKSKRPSPPAEATAAIGDLTVTIQYNSPSVKGRQIWGELVPFDKVWRTGANEATTFEVNQDVLIEGQKLSAGKYALFTIPGQEEWIFIFNNEPGQWGAYNYNQKKDALRVTVKPGKAAQLTERLTFDIATKGDQAGYVSLSWENLAVGFNITKE
jgi:hypothetical protein